MKARTSIARNKKSKIKRYIRVSKRRVKRATGKKIGDWFKFNLTQHPFILGILLFAWIDGVIIRGMQGKESMSAVVRFHALLAAVWFVSVVISNMLKDTKKTKWYLKKRFIFFNLVVLAPLGLILLWSGAHFKKITRIVLSIFFVSYFVVTSVHYNKKYEALMSKTSVERVMDLITKPKKKVNLRKVDRRALGGIQFFTLAKKNRVKLATSDIALRCSGSVVSVKILDKNGAAIGMGSGFIVAENGIIATNFHVIESAYGAEIKIGEEVFKHVEFIAGMPEFDLALIKIDAKGLVVLPFGNSDEVTSGQFVLVLGNPEGFERSLSTGVISSVREGGNVKLLQMTAPVSPGSSGGPVINEYGEVVGITTVASLFMAQNLNFAVPVNYLEKLVK